MRVGAVHVLLGLSQPCEPGHLLSQPCEPGPYHVGGADGPPSQAIELLTIFAIIVVGIGCKRSAVRTIVSGRPSRKQYRWCKCVQAVYAVLSTAVQPCCPQRCTSADPD